MPQVAGRLGRELEVDVGPPVDHGPLDGQDLDLLRGRREHAGGQGLRDLLGRSELVDRALVGRGDRDGDRLERLDDVLVDDVLAVDAVFFPVFFRFCFEGIFEGFWRCGRERRRGETKERRKNREKPRALGFFFSLSLLLPLSLFLEIQIKNQNSRDLLPAKGVRELVAVLGVLDGGELACLLLSGGGGEREERKKERFEQEEVFFLVQAATEERIATFFLAFAPSPIPISISTRALSLSPYQDAPFAAAGPAGSIAAAPTATASESVDASAERRVGAAAGIAAGVAGEALEALFDAGVGATACSIARLSERGVQETRELGGGERGRKGKRRELPSIWAGKKKPIDGKKAWRYSAEGSPRSPALVAHFGAVFDVPAPRRERRLSSLLEWREKKESGGKGAAREKKEVSRRRTFAFFLSLSFSRPRPVDPSLNSSPFFFFSEPSRFFCYNATKGTLCYCSAEAAAVVAA